MSHKAIKFLDLMVQLKGNKVNAEKVIGLEGTVVKILVLSTQLSMKRMRVFNSKQAKPQLAKRVLKLCAISWEVCSTQQ